MSFSSSSSPSFTNNSNDEKLHTQTSKSSLKFSSTITRPNIPSPIKPTKLTHFGVTSPLHSFLFLTFPWIIHLHLHRILLLCTILFLDLFHLPKHLSKASISQFFYDSLALSAWKTTGFSAWSLRVNPSSGNLHPTEVYLITPPIESLSDSPFVAHYAPKEHSLELRATIPSDFFPKIFPQNSFLIGISSIFWREAWKYGERAFRYSNHDVGHATAAIAMAAAGLGWDVMMLDGLGFKELERVMGLEWNRGFHIPDNPIKGNIPDVEFEHPDCLLLVFPNGVSNTDVNYKELSSAIAEFKSLDWKGKPNSVSKEKLEEKDINNGRKVVD